jgi:UDP-N-acetylmuramate: L-alanyl-gamma-D-glutamyl-meso-diaminopimelate ligase
MSAATTPALPAGALPGPAERQPEPRPAVDWASVRRVHLIGIGGSAMGNFAGLLASRGLEVRGSDAGVFDPMRSNLARWRIPTLEGYAAEHLDWGPDLVVVGNVVRRDNPEAVAMRARGLPYASFPEALGEWLLAGRTPCVVTGTHGKTTTTALLAWLLHAAGRQPGLLVGGVPHDLGASFLAGAEGAPFVLEGDEYDTAYYDKRPKFVHYRPHHAILTSVEFDHADIYPDFAAVQRAFRLLAGLVAPDGLLVAWGEDPRVVEVLDAARCRVLRYGLREPGAGAAALDAYACELAMADGETRFRLIREGVDLGLFTSRLPGRHNVRNTVAALLTALDLGLDADQARAALARFTGVRKRQELRGVADGVAVLDDYAHHPTAVQETVAAIRAAWPGRRLWALFEAESNTSRRQVFQQAYVDAFASAGADEVIFCSPLRKAGDGEGGGGGYLDCDALVAALRGRGVAARYLPEVDAIVEAVAREAGPGDVVLAMSGRDFRGLHGRLLERLAARAGAGAEAAGPAA